VFNQANSRGFRRPGATLLENSLPAVGAWGETREEDAERNRGKDQETMSDLKHLDFWANWAAILTAAVAAFAYFRFQWGIRKKRLELEAYLKREKETDPNILTQGQHNIVFLMAKLGLTSDEILQASFRSKKIDRLPVQNPEFKRAVDILFRYNGPTTNVAPKAVADPPPKSDGK
jgi:hypothetical protein